METQFYEACGHMVRTKRNADGTGGYFVLEFPMTNPNRCQDAEAFVLNHNLRAEQMIRRIEREKENNKSITI